MMFGAGILPLGKNLLSSVAVSARHLLTSLIHTLLVMLEEWVPQMVTVTGEILKCTTIMHILVPSH